MKKIFTVLLVLMMLAAFSACGGKYDDNSFSENDSLIEDKVEIKGDSVIQTMKIVGGGYQTVEYAFESNTLKKVILTSESTVDVTESSFNDLKLSLEQRGYSDVKLSGKTITAVCSDISSSAYEAFSSFNKENLKLLLEGEAPNGNGEGTDEQTADYRINWEDIKYIPSGMPKLANKVTEDFSDEAAKSLSIGWNIISKSDMEDMKTELEEWLGVEIEKIDMGDMGTECYMYTGDTSVITIYYYETVMVGMSQCTISYTSYE